MPDNGGVRTDAAIAQSQIASVYPGLSWNGKATQSLLHKSPLFRASYSFYKVGQYTTFGGYEAGAAGRRAVLRRAHIDRLPGLHGRRGVRGPARGQAAREDARQRLTAAAPISGTAALTLVSAPTSLQAQADRFFAGTGTPAIFTLTEKSVLLVVK